MLIKFITEIGKKKRKLGTFWEWEVQMEKYTIKMIFVLTYNRMT